MSSLPSRHARVRQECLSSYENLLSEQLDDNMPAAATVVGQIMSASHFQFDDLNINLDNKFPPVECNVDEVLNHEVSLGGNLDFTNFNPPAPPQPSVATTHW